MTGSSQQRRVVPTVAVGALACVVVLLAGCGSSAKTKTTSTVPGSATSLSSRRAVSPSASAVSSARLAKIVLQRSDLPAGWKATPYEPDPNEAAEDAFFARCLGVASLHRDRVAEVNSDDFSRGDADISSSADSYRSQSAVDSQVAVLHSPKAAPCFEQLAKQQSATTLPAGAEIESVSLKITPGSAGGPANVVATMGGIIKISANGQHVSLYGSVAFITGPLITAEVDAENPGAPVPASLLAPLIDKVANRAAQG
jgi:hypothetical protein